jgi:hypothetical protein
LNGVVHRQDLDRRAAGGGDAHDSLTLGLKMVVPLFEPGIEQRNGPSGVRVGPGVVRPLVPIAERAEEREVIQLGRAKVLRGDDTLFE